MAQVSIIVPAYNSAPFIGDCLESVMGQDFSDFELIVVDDGSSDATPEVVRAKCHGRIDYKLVQQPHSGPSCARNRGIRCSSGRYLLFLDSDDSLADNALSVCVSQLELHALDALLFEGVVVANEGIPLRNRKYYAGRPPHLHGRIVDGERIFAESVLLDRYIESAVMYMTRSEAMAGHFFPEGQLYEDSVFTTRLLLSGRLPRAMCISKRLYRRRSRRGSITSSPPRLVNHTSLVAVYEALTELAAGVTERRTRDCLHRYRRIFLTEAIACSTRVHVPYSRRLGVAREILADRELPGRLRLCVLCLLASPEHPGP